MCHMQVYEVLEKHFKNCPWPVPPSAILMHLPVQEDREKGLTSEAILRDIVSRDKKQRNCFPWIIRDVGVRPDKTVFDDGTTARIRPHRHYAFREGVKPQVSENSWATFLNAWDSRDLSTATNLVCAHVIADLDADEQELLWTLRKFHRVLLLDKDDPLCAYQMRLRSLHRLGMINLSFARPDASLALLMARKRSLEASLRESRKRNERATRTLGKMQERYDVLEADRDAQVKLTEHAQAKLAEARVRLAEFQAQHPHHRHEPDEELVEEDDDDVRLMFEQVDKDVDVQQQLKYDPSGALACFWADQRKQLSRPGRARRWNPQVIPTHTHTHTHTRARARARITTHTRTHCLLCRCRC